MTRRVWRIGAGVFATLVLAHSLWFAWRYFQPTPWLDMWDCIAEFEKWPAGTYGFGDLIAQHNDHRIATARLFFIADALLFRMTGRFVVIANMILLAGIGLMLHRLWRSAAVRGTAADLPSVFFVAAMASVCQWENLVTPFQIQFALMSGSVIMSVVCVVAAGSAQMAARRSSLLALCGGCGYATAAFSMAGGVLVLPLLLVLISVRRLRPIPTLMFLLPVCTALLLFFHHYVFYSLRLPLAGYHATPLLLVAGMIRISTGFVGSPLGAFGEAAALAAGAAGLLVLGWHLLRAAQAWRGGVALSGRVLALLALACWVVANAAAAGRLRLSFGGMASRYTQLSLIFFICLGALAVQAALRAPKSRGGIWVSRSAMVPVLASAALLCVNSSPVYEQQANGLLPLLQVAGSTLRAGVYAPGLLNILNPFGLDQVMGAVQFAHRNRLSAFAASARPPRAVRDALRSADVARLPSCLGALDMLYRLDATRSVMRGWLALGGQTADWIEIVDQAGHVAGVLPAQENRDGLPMAGGRSAGMGVLGALASGMADGPATMVGVFEGAARCRLKIRGPGPVRVSPLAAGTRDALPVEAAPPVPGARPDLAPPRPGAAYWSDTAAPAGHVSLQVAAPRDTASALAVPFATGQNSAGQSLQFVFADGARTALPIPADSQAAHWRVAALPADMLARHPGAVTISLDDPGASQENWLAVGAPFAETLDPDAARLP